ncbi:uncharacterized protein PODANS_3_9060 [Podospora anserina S mat+]|uniref:Podospora anserina S mat+ genomic DNA chromosome 3, supercontig 2 n=1 Tax=Podospora anserina (strain S / ATCC MYA-4624 / DSM 980 / FGSC 10383) TaxID=515849 RepID=B2B1D8_PODAN|nr:uncharacterized protein PODANS_3_9060 [Podospora anserina S mat+]CAP70848.1 unnamed protein product [Podospora anserina S mat+]CDP27442.1 Putative protein of unknown function [Podospora anserina S mat+]
MPRRTPTPNLTTLTSKLESASTRLRKTFKYTDDNSTDDDIPEVMDEQGIPLPLPSPPLYPFTNLSPEQETLITTLTTRNAHSNTLTLRLLLTLPVLSSLPYLLLFPTSPPIFPLLAFSSLSSTLYLLYTLPVTSTGFNALDKPPPSMQGKIIQPPVAKSPLEEYLPWLNLLLVTVLALMGLVQEKTGKSGGPHPVLLGVLPGVVYGVCVATKKTMAGVDVEKELGRLRYGYKGA